MELLDCIAWLILRVGYTSLYFYAAFSFTKNFDDAKNLCSLLASFNPTIPAILMILVMYLGGLSILLGLFSTIGALLITIFNLAGVYVHYKLADIISNHKASSTSTSTSEVSKAEETALALGIVGNVTSAQKNIVLAAVSIFIMLVGTGPLSLTNSLF